jgi:hypothetical protein
MKRQVIVILMALLAVTATGLAAAEIEPPGSFDAPRDATPQFSYMPVPTRTDEEQAAWEAERLPTPTATPTAMPVPRPARPRDYDAPRGNR